MNVCRMLIAGALWCASGGLLCAQSAPRVEYPQSQVYPYPPPSPIWYDGWEPWPFSPRVFGVPYVAAVENPTGHAIHWTGPNSYVYSPVYGPGLDREEPLWKLARRPSEPIAVPLQAVPREVAQADRWLGLAVRDFHRGQYAASALSLARMEDETPGSAPAEVLRVALSVAQGKYERAAAALVRITEALPAEAWDLVLAHRDEFYARPGDLAEQVQALEAAARTGDARTWLVLGHVYGGLGRRDAALAALARSQELAKLEPWLAAAAGRLAAHYRAAMETAREF